ncbi:MAG: N-acetylneuraminate synthase [Pseudomonadota bacterium]|nr:N-acetylneuraminate synthase [Pseudomonadota bacterium]
MIKIGNRHIGVGQPCFIIAEAGVNHNGRLDFALKLVDAAVAAGVDAIKFQTFKSDLLVARNADKAEYQRRRTGENESQFEMIKRLELTYNEFGEIYAYCRKKRIVFLSTPFDHDSVDFLDDQQVMAFKISSGEITNFPLLRHIAGKGKPIILSTGMSFLGEVEKALEEIYSCENKKIILLHCVSNYPAAPKDVNLKAMNTMSMAFQIPVGYSDHTLGIEVSLAAAALGACVIEKHFTLDRRLDGPDHESSLEPDELRSLVKGIRTIEAAMGNGRKMPMPGEENVLKVARRSLVAACDIPPGTLLTKEHIAIKRPGTGLPPAMMPCLVGRKVRGAIEADAMFDWEMLT